MGRALDQFEKSWKTHTAKLGKTPSKELLEIMNAIKTSVMEVIPLIVDEIISTKQKVDDMKVKIDDLEKNPPVAIEKTLEDPREAFSTKFACNSEVQRVKNTLIVEFRSDHVLGTGKQLPGKDFMTDINAQMKTLVDKQGKKPAELKAADMKWTKIATPRNGSHADSTFYRLHLNRPFSKKALFQMLKIHGQTKYPTMSVRNETPGFLKQAKHEIDHIAAMIRNQTKKVVRTRAIFNPKRQSMDLQTSRPGEEGVMTFVTIVSSDPDPKNGEAMKIPDGDIVRGNPELEVILQKISGYVPPEETESA